MNNDKIQELKRLAKEADDAPTAWPFYLVCFQKKATPAAVLELIALAEATPTIRDAEAGNPASTAAAAPTITYWSFANGNIRRHPEGGYVDRADHLAAITATRQQEREEAEDAAAELQITINNLRARLASAGAGSEPEAK